MMNHENESHIGGFTLKDDEHELNENAEYPQLTQVSKDAKEQAKAVSNNPDPLNIKKRFYNHEQYFNTAVSSYRKQLLK